MKKLKICCALLCFVATLSEAWFWPSTKKSAIPFPNWSKLSVKFGVNTELPMTEADARNKGWTKDTNCDGSSFFRGNRYVLGDDTGVMLLFDSRGQVAGIQSAMPDTVDIAKNRIPPFHKENGKYYLTAYFIDPKTICNAAKRDGIGNALHLQTKSTWQETMEVPLTEDKLAQAGTKWVKGKCFNIPFVSKKMGQHYWYDISNDMSCDDFFPVFLLYNDGILNGFGWSSKGKFDNPNFEHPPSYVLGCKTAFNINTCHVISDIPQMLPLFDLDDHETANCSIKFFFDSKTRPTCLNNVDRSTMHIYLQPVDGTHYPLCPVFG